jgi:hypothetical protein
MWIGYVVSDQQFAQIIASEWNKSTVGFTINKQYEKLVPFTVKDPTGDLFWLGVALQSILWVPLAAFNTAGIVQAIRSSIEEANGGMFYAVIFFVVNFVTFARFPWIFACQWLVPECSPLQQVSYEKSYIIASFSAKFSWQVAFFATVHQWLTMS